MGTMSPPPSDLVPPAGYQQALAMGGTLPPSQESLAPPPGYAQAGPPVPHDFKPFRPGQPVAQGGPAKLMVVLGFAFRTAIVLFAVLSLGLLASVLSEVDYGTDHNWNFLIAAMALMFIANVMWIIVGVLQTASVLDTKGNASLTYLLTSAMTISDLVFAFMAVSAASATSGGVRRYCSYYYTEHWCSRIRAASAFGFLASFCQIAVLLMNVYNLHKLLLDQAQSQPQPQPVPYPAMA